METTRHSQALTFVFVTTPLHMDGGPLGPLGPLGLAGFLAWIAWLATYGVVLLLRAPKDANGIAAAVEPVSVNA